MAIEQPQFRIIPDPTDSKLWAYELLAHDRKFSPVGGFKTAQVARKACDRSRSSGAARVHSP